MATRVPPKGGGNIAPPPPVVRLPRPRLPARPPRLPKVIPPAAPRPERSPKRPNAQPLADGQRTGAANGQRKGPPRHNLTALPLQGNAQRPELPRSATKPGRRKAWGPTPRQAAEAEGRHRGIT